MEHPKLTVVSVCYNCENEVAATMESLLEQSFQDYEYIIVDGNSKDTTLQIIKSYSSRFSNIKIISEPDRGIYDAMNKGVRNSTGDYIYFLNFGDYLVDKYVLERVVSSFASKQDYYYGNIAKDEKIVSQNGKNSLFMTVYREYMLCHQSLFAKRCLLVENPFNLEYKICADRDWFIRILKQGAKGEFVDIVICNYDTSGVSSNYKNFSDESMSITQKYGGLFGAYFAKGKRLILLVSIVFSALSGFLGSIFTAVKDSKIFAVSTVISAIVNCILNAILIPMWGIQGAAIATAISFFLIWFIRLICTRKYIKWRINLVVDIVAYVILVIQVVLEHFENHNYVGQIICLIILLLLYRKQFLSSMTLIINKFTKRRV